MAVCVAYAARGQTAGAYPAKLIRFTVPLPTGSGPDANARVLVAGLSLTLGQQILIDNQPGANGIVGTQIAFKATPDGYTLLLATASVFATVPSLYADLPFDLDRDFMPISQIELIPRALVESPSVPAKTVAALIALARAEPGSLNYGTAGNGTFHHLSAELFKSLTGTDTKHVSCGAGTPRDVAGRLRAAIADTVKSADVAEKLTSVSAGYIVGNTPDEFTAFIRAEHAKWARVIKQVGIKLEL
jgi:tripartite-type tricarboxylate transporter receptor subunit TctC